MPKAAGITSGGVLLACLALVATLAMGRDAPKPPMTVLAAAEPGPSKLPVAPSSAMTAPARAKSGRLAAAHAMAARADRHRLPAASPRPNAPASHLLASAEFGPSEAFAPMTIARTLPAASAFVLAKPSADETPVETAALNPADAGVSRWIETGRQEKAEIQAAAAPAPKPEPEPDHIEIALPDLPAAAAIEPAGARAAIERELALAVPKPTARPFRQPSGADVASIEAPAVRRRDRAPAALLAYARPDAGALGDEPPALEIPMPAGPRIGAGTAVYDISAATVYLPNGERLEAHSGLGTMRDDARFVHQKNRGPTPPHTYNLTLRESLFHGVAAIRLNPVGGERYVHNRVGLLAHTYMLGPRGDSNGCVSFKDYKRFLAAFKRGEIRRLVVVPSYKRPTSRLASLFSRGRT